MTRSTAANWLRLSFSITRNHNPAPQHGQLHHILTAPSCPGPPSTRIRSHPCNTLSTLHPSTPTSVSMAMSKASASASPPQDSPISTASQAGSPISPMAPCNCSPRALQNPSKHCLKRSTPLIRATSRAKTAQTTPPHHPSINSTSQAETHSEGSLRCCVRANPEQANPQTTAIARGKIRHRHRAIERRRRHKDRQPIHLRTLRCQLDQPALSRCQPRRSAEPQHRFAVRIQPLAMLTLEPHAHIPHDNRKQQPRCRSQRRILPRITLNRRAIVKPNHRQPSWPIKARVRTARFRHDAPSPRYWLRPAPRCDL